MLLKLCGEEVETRLKSVLGPASLARMGEQEVLEEVRRQVDWGWSKARLQLAKGMGRDVAEELEEFTARVRVVAASCDFHEQCDKCGDLVDFTWQMVRDRMALGDSGHEDVMDDNLKEVLNLGREESTNILQNSIDQKIMIDIVEEGKMEVEIEETSSVSTSRRTKRSGSLGNNESSIKVEGNKRFACSNCTNSKVYKTLKGLERHQIIFCTASKVVRRLKFDGKKQRKASILQMFMPSQKGDVGEGIIMDNIASILTRMNEDNKIEKSESKTNETSGLESGQMLPASDSGNSAVKGELMVLSVSLHNEAGVKKIRCKVQRNSPVRVVIQKVCSKFGLSPEEVRFKCDETEVEEEEFVAKFEEKEIHVVRI